MSFTQIVDLSSDDELGEVDVKPVKLEPGVTRSTVQQKEHQSTHLAQNQSRREESGENRSSTAQSGTSLLERSPVDDTDLTSSSTICPAPLLRQFWKAGNYEDVLGSKITLQNGKNHLHVHPMFLHSNATSHKWIFGAVAELVDNAIDEIQNGATFVILDKILNPRDGSPALLIQDDGSGMDSEAMRRCMSFGFSDKKSKSAIGQYGNGFKTSTMRLGADAIVFSRHHDERTLTQSIGLLSYTFLIRTGHDRIVVPMVDYQVNESTGTWERLHRYGTEHFMSNMSILLQWSPYSSEAELLKQFDDMGAHGTRIIIYNVWFNEDGNAELDFDTDPEDIRVGGETTKFDKLPLGRPVMENHIAKHYHYSLRVYLSILYLRVPENFRIVLRGKVVVYHNIANDLKYPEFILYKPHRGGSVEGEVLTTIGFIKEAPNVNVHGFNVYHKNRLILPFWQVLSYSNSRGRGVVGVLEANFVEPTHNKQDFERTSLFQKLESRLKDMTCEYWDYHCGLIGYYDHKKPRAPVAPQISSHYKPSNDIEQPVTLSQDSVAAGDRKVKPVEAFQGPEANSLSIPNSEGRVEQGLHIKRKEHGIGLEHEKVKKHAGTKVNIVAAAQVQPASTTVNQFKDQETENLLLENKKLNEKCSEYEKEEKQLSLKVTLLRIELQNIERECALLLAELQASKPLKEERGIHM